MKTFAFSGYRGEAVRLWVKMIICFRHWGLEGLLSKGDISEESAQHV
jgi:hypothetical protein